MTMKLESLGEIRKIKISLKKSKTEDYVVRSVCNKRKREPDEKPSNKWKTQCGTALDALLDHRFGFVFSCPVDPVALNVPDYFSIITRPMDLGTIKHKLANDDYRDAQEFAADVKLAFSNAMLYNPADNQVYAMAKELEALFLERWKVLEVNWNDGSVPSDLRMSNQSVSVNEKKKLNIGLEKPGIEIPRKDILPANGNKSDQDSLDGTSKSSASSHGSTAKSVTSNEAHPDQLKIEARRIEERNARAAFEETSKRRADEDKVDAYDELLKLCGCSVSYDSRYGVVLRPRELEKTGKVVDPLASFGWHLKKHFTADYDDDHVSDVEPEEGEIVE